MIPSGPNQLQTLSRHSAGHVAAHRLARLPEGPPVLSVSLRTGLATHCAKWKSLRSTLPVNMDNNVTPVLVVCGPCS